MMMNVDLNDKHTKQSTDSYWNAGPEMFRLEVHSDLGYGEDAEGRDEGCHQVVLVVTS